MPRHKYIREYSDSELNAAIDSAVTLIPGFWIIMKGVDAYLERRRRRENGQSNRQHRSAMNEFPWDQ